MTKQIILPMNEITDSVEMLHEKPNKGMPVFTWILVLLLAAAISWCCIGEIDYFIKASGIVLFPTIYTFVTYIIFSVVIL